MASSSACTSAKELTHNKFYLLQDQPLLQSLKLMGCSGVSGRIACLYHQRRPPRRRCRSSWPAARSIPATSNTSSTNAPPAGRGRARIAAPPTAGRLLCRAAAPRWPRATRLVPRPYCDERRGAARGCACGRCGGGGACCDTSSARVRGQVGRGREASVLSEVRLGGGGVGSFCTRWRLGVGVG